MTSSALRQGPSRGRNRVVPCSLAVLVLFAACYIGGPFLTLWRITQAVGSGDLAALQSLVDWDSVRQGLKDDIADGVIGMPQQTLIASNSLPPFGASFVSGIASSAVDRAVTPQGLLNASRLLDPMATGEAEPAFPAIVQAAFTAPTEFDLRLRAPCQDADEEPMHIRLAIHGGFWQVVRVWIPQDMMERAGSRT